jgi:DNA-directed RNA polymerase specialized sigma24 family protein
MSRVDESHRGSGALARAAAANRRIRQLEDELRAEYERRGIAVVEAADVEGYSYRQIAAEIGVKYATVYKIIAMWA